MDRTTIGHEIQSALEEIPLLDAHTHLDATHLAARGLHDLLLYHMVISDLSSAGCPDRTRLSETPSEEEARSRIERALPYLPAIANTSCFWGFRIILKDLYDWDKPVTPANWRKLDAAVRERSGDPRWPLEILKKAGIVRSSTEYWRRHDGSADEMLQYSLEWAFFGRSAWGEYDTGLYELEKAWSEGVPSPPSPIAAGGRPVPSRSIHSLKDVHDALDAYVDAIPSNVLSTAQHISTDIDFRLIDEKTMSAAMARRAKAGPAERDIYAAYTTEEFWKRLEARRGSVVYQFSLGAEPLPHETASRVYQRTLVFLSEAIARHPGIRFQCFLGASHANQTLCTIARELPNLSLAGYWWHNFFPTVIARIIRERLDMLSTSRQIGFFSDAYTLEWSYAKAVMVRRILSGVLADKVLDGQYDKKTAIDTARRILFDSPRELLGMEPAVTAVRAGGQLKTRKPREG